MNHYIRSFFNAYMATGKTNVLPIVAKARTDALQFVTNNISLANTLPKRCFTASDLDYWSVTYFLAHKLPESSSFANVYITQALNSNPSLMQNHHHLCVTLKHCIHILSSSAHTFNPPQYLVTAFREYYYSKEGAANLFIHCAFAKINNKEKFLCDFAKSVFSIDLSFLPLTAFNLENQGRQEKFLKWLQIQFLFVLYHHLSSTHLATQADTTADAIFNNPWEIFSEVSSDAVEFRALYNVRIKYFSTYYVHVLQGLLHSYIQHEYIHY